MESIADKNMNFFCAEPKTDYLSVHVTYPIVAMDRCKQDFKAQLDR